MARLPTPGSDRDTWGDILNDYLKTSHYDDGTLRSGVVGASQLQDNSIPEVKLQGNIPQSKITNLTAELSTKATTSDITSLDTRLDTVETTLPAKADQTALQAEIDARVSQSAVFVSAVGTAAAPVTDPATARPATDAPVYWLCANSVTPTNAVAGDLIWNAS